MAPPVARGIGKLLDEGALTVDAANLADLLADGSGFLAVARDGRCWPAAAVVNCTGPGGATGTPLGQRLLADGLARPDALGLGLDVDLAGRLVAADGRAWDAVRVVGPPRRGGWWETTAVPEIRTQVHAL
jgi:uncharacterized NAD(P)/FAD-binding protein YdhS